MFTIFYVYEHLLISHYFLLSTYSMTSDYSSLIALLLCFLSLYSKAPPSALKQARALGGILLQALMTSAFSKLLEKSWTGTFRSWMEAVGCLLNSDKIQTRTRSPKETSLGSRWLGDGSVPTNHSVPKLGVQPLSHPESSVCSGTILMEEIFLPSADRSDLRPDHLLQHVQIHYLIDSGLLKPVYDLPSKSPAQHVILFPPCTLHSSSTWGSTTPQYISSCLLDLVSHQTAELYPQTLDPFH